jgi:peroxiredoxin
VKKALAISLIVPLLLWPLWMCPARGEGLQDRVYPVGQQKPLDSQLKVHVGDQAPDFTLPSLKDGKITLRQYRGKKNVVLSFVPAAWTPVCSDQWPGYNIARNMIEKYDAVLLGITVDNLPTLYAWTKEMGDLWFPVLSDFWPHGSTAERYGILRSDGVSERALFVIDKQGIMRYVDVHDINTRPDLDALIGALADLPLP